MMYGLDEYGRATFDRRMGRPFLVPRAPCGRLTLTSGNANPTASATAATTIYWTPYLGNFVELYDTTMNQWVPRTFSERSVAVPSTLFRLLDLFSYWDGDSVELETVNWNQTTGTATAATAAAPSVITSAAHGLSNGDLVGLAGFNNTVGSDATNGLNGTVWTVANVAANTFEAQGSNTAGLVASTAGTWYKIPQTRATALTTQDNRQVKTGDASRLYLGTSMTTGTSGQTECSFGGVDSTPLWLLWNFWNRKLIRLRYGDSTDSYTYTTYARRPMNNLGKSARAGFVIGLNENVPVIGLHAQIAGNDTGAYTQVGLDLDGLANFDNFIKPLVGAPANQEMMPWALYADAPGIGFHYLGAMELAEAVGITTWRGDYGTPDETQSGLNVFLEV